MPDQLARPTLYTQAGCAESAKVRGWLVERRIAFTEGDAGVDPVAAQLLAATGTFATPLLVLGKEKILGFRPEAIAAALARVRQEG